MRLRSTSHSSQSIQFFFPLTSSFLLPLLPRYPALSSQNPSPINPSFSSLALLLRLVKTGITGIAKTLIFDHPHDHRRARPSPSICVMAQGLPACCPHRDCWRSATLEALRDQWTRYCIVDIQSWAQHLFVNTHASVWYGRRDHWSCPQRVVTFTRPSTISRGVNGGILLRIGDFNSILTHWICLRSTRVKYVIGCFPLVTLAATGVTSNGLLCCSCNSSL